jgi:hypothetical protein
VIVAVVLFIFAGAFVLLRTICTKVRFGAANLRII